MEVAVGGMGVGIVCSVLLFKRKPWPLIMGSGLGLGMGISDCNHEFRGSKIKVRKFEGIEGGAQPTGDTKSA